MFLAGYLKQDLERILGCGKIPLLSVESLEVVRWFRNSSTDCFVAFLQPSSFEWYENKVRTWLTETPEAQLQYAAFARQQALTVLSSGVFDFFLPSSCVGHAVKQLRCWIQALNPDLFKDASAGRFQNTSHSHESTA